MNPRLILASISAVAALALPGFVERVHTQAAQLEANSQLPSPNSQGVRPAWAWKPAMPAANDGQVHVLPVRGKVYMLVGAGGNITVQAGDDGVLIVDAGVASMSDKVLAAVRTISRGPIRYIVNTGEREEFTGGNEKLAAAGSTIRFRVSTDPRVSDGLAKDRASVISYVTIFQRMSAPTGKVAPRVEEAWPDNTYSTPQKRLFFNDEPVVIVRLTANTDGNSIVLFRKSDVVSTGDLFDLTEYPLIDLKAGGSIQAMVDSLNRLIDITVPEANAAGGTLVVPGHGRISDHADVVYYRDMVSIIRDRIQDMIRQKMTLAQVKAARPTREYDARYGKQTGAWTTDMFVEAAYQSLSK